MRQKLRVFFFLVLMAAFAGCATTGPLPGVREGQTKREEIKSMFGEPDSKSAGSQGEEWHYRFERDAKDGSVTVLNIKFLFSDDELLKYEITSAKETRQKAEDPDKRKGVDERNPPPPGPHRPFPPPPRPPFR